MENFKKVAVSSDKKTADIGPGNRWVDVYTTLEKSGVGVVGGRVSELRAKSNIQLINPRWPQLVSQDLS